MSSVAPMLRLPTPIESDTHLKNFLKAVLSTVSPLTREPLSEMRSASSREAADAQIISIINPKTRRNPRVLRRGLQNVTFVGAWFLL